MSFEQPDINNIDRKMLLDKAYPKAVADIKKWEINMRNKSFIKLYGEEAIKSDEEEIERCKKHFDKVGEGQMLGTLAEWILIFCGEQNDWFGENASTIKTSEYDDIKNKIDILIKFTEQEIYSSYMGLAIDITINENYDQKFSGKMKKIKKDIKDGNLGELKYGKLDNITGRVENIPEVLIGIKGSAVRELTEMMMEKKHKSLAKHPVQLGILHQIKNQLEVMVKIVEKQDDIKKIKTLEGTLNLISDLLAKKEQLFKENRWDDEYKKYMIENFSEIIEEDLED